ncbi:MAG: hypothetical protein A2408_01310 [Candidatus Yonathbacteria bacterium RIFOXYC1_FULL_52_10]|uniref:Solute-binding protein family 5 domain-containing protein n=1 Tax=Candidatus Yonathbacteria bacterium RIFOXYD1_FULL_52_36 TaxID=1802730 RepID=A0A1G2SHT5_9BACT|nr:MAG: hypothetical protein A2591_03245 [Candidatus Yonathbacteria bacterium RIFOXYD1_FULL_52_36]OHA85000.1 MAG: hypothetical protein A2408_01310 [Candidatus Yonathbacteria bacterium RIFOXYC1_FULL_52_10]
MLKKTYYALVRLLGSRFELKGEQTLTRAIHTFSPAGRRVFLGLTAIFMVSALVLLYQVNRAFLTPVPHRGGTLTEGVVGAPKFINPLLATSDADRDLSALVYSGLMRKTNSGELIPDLAASYEMSPDGLSYTFILRPDVVFHDGEPVTANDVVFTIGKAKETIAKSDIRGRWDGVGVEVIDPQTVRFVLKKPYVSFLDNTTLGILPEHLWGDTEQSAFVSSTLNVEPIGSGPYRVASFKQSRDGKTINSYKLTAFSRFALGEPNIQTIQFSFFADEDTAVKALRKGDVESIASISPKTIAELKTEWRSVLSFPEQRLYGIFLNQTQAPIFADAAVRSVIEQTSDRAKIAEEVFSGNVTPLSRPIPPGILGFQEEVFPTALTPEQIQEARTVLEDAGWEFDEAKNVLVKTQKKETLELRFTLATRNIPELKAVAEILATTWEQVGIRVELSYFDEGDLRETIIRPRKYDALLFGGIFPAESALYSFWHSSQRNDPGYNITMYANPATDKVLERIYSVSTMEERLAGYKTFIDEIISDKPATFLYAPNLLYVVPGDLNGIAAGVVTDPSERFGSVYEWYRETDFVWKIFQ